MPLGERPPLVVCLENPEPHIHVFWGAQFVIPSFAQPTPEDGKFLVFAKDILLVLLPATVVVQPEWLTPVDVAVSQAAEMEALLARLAPGHPSLHPDNPITDRVFINWASLAPLYIVHQLMFSHFLAPETAWQMMHVKPDAIRMT